MYLCITIAGPRLLAGFHWCHCRHWKEICVCYDRSNKTSRL